jgi:DNA replication protein DnaC
VRGGGAFMSEIFTRLGLTQLEHQLPTLLETARQRQWTYEVFLEQALQAETTGRQERALHRRLRAAKLPTNTTLEGFEFPFQPTLNERLIGELATGGFVTTATNIVLLGPPGVGKPRPTEYSAKSHCGTAGDRHHR